MKNITLPEDPILREFLPEFIDDWLLQIKEQGSALLRDRDNTEDLYRLGHTLKGSCFQFKFDEIAALGIALMDCAKNNDWEGAERLIDEASASFAAIKVYLQQEEK